jgi:hypothetical protein
MAKYKSFNTLLDDNYIYISHLDEGFQFWKLPTWPETVTDTMSSNFAQTNALGRTAPVYTFSNSGPRTVQIAIPLHRDLMDDVNIGISNSELGEGEDYVDNLVRALQAIAVPKYNLKNKAVEPPMVAIRLSNEIFIKGIVSGAIGITYSKPILSNGKYARIELSITVSEVDPYDATTVFKNGGFRGVVQSLKKGMNLED